MTAPVWLQRLASWLNARINYGPRDHVVHWKPFGTCPTCMIWEEHDDCFNDGPGLYVTESAGVALLEAGKR